MEKKFLEEVLALPMCGGLESRKDEKDISFMAVLRNDGESSLHTKSDHNRLKMVAISVRKQPRETGLYWAPLYGRSQVA